MKIAIMQPYFIPYAGYFRLFCAADLFVVYDCVQFPRRSFVHRNKLYTDANMLDWLTLPLQKQAMNTLIQNMLFREEGKLEWKNDLNRFPAFKILEKKYASLFSMIANLDINPAHYIVRSLQEICRILDVPCNVTYSAELAISKEMKGQDRILEIVKHYRATEYINSPGGRELYNESDFERHGVKLTFLPEFKGDYHSIIHYLTDHHPEQIREMLFSQCGS